MVGTVDSIDSGDTVQITLEDTGIVQSRFATRKRVPKVPAEVRRAGADAISLYAAFRTRQRGVSSDEFVIEHIELATC
jgi:tRNA (Thr-GGU) A37 N-methylase